MLGLVGDWEAVTEDGKVVRIAYWLALTDGSLVEILKMPSGQEILTVAHLDGRSLMLTHYSGLGNQPRLRFVRASDEGP